MANSGSISSKSSQFAKIYAMVVRAQRIKEKWTVIHMGVVKFALRRSHHDFTLPLSFTNHSFLQPFRHGLILMDRLKNMILLYPSTYSMLDIRYIEIFFRVFPESKI